MDVRHANVRHTEVWDAPTPPPGAGVAAASVACSTCATVLVAWALRQVISVTVAPPIMNIAKNANVEGDKTWGTAHNHRATTHDAETPSAENVRRPRELE